MSIEPYLLLNIECLASRLQLSSTGEAVYVQMDGKRRISQNLPLQQVDGMRCVALTQEMYRRLQERAQPPAWIAGIEGMTNLGPILATIYGPGRAHDTLDSLFGTELDDLRKTMSKTAVAYYTRIHRQVLCIDHDLRLLTTNCPAAAQLPTPEEVEKELESVPLEQITPTLNVYLQQARSAAHQIKLIFGITPTT